MQQICKAWEHLLQTAGFQADVNFENHGYLRLAAIAKTQLNLLLPITHAIFVLDTIMNVLLNNSNKIGQTTLS